MSTQSTPPGSRPSRAWAWLLAVTVLTPACGEGAAPAQAASEQPPAPVEVGRARAGELIDEWRFIGEVRSLRSAQLALGAGGEIVAIEVREGDRVEAGALLVEIDKRQASARLSAAVSSRRESERQLEQARREAERAASLGGQVLSSEEIERETVEADTLEVRKRRLGAEIRAAKAQLSDYQLVAPFAGIIAGRHADLGQWVNPGDPVLELVATDEVEILVEVRPELAPQLHVGAEVQLRPAGGIVGVGVGSREPNHARAEIVGVVPALDPGTRTLEVRLRPLEPRTWLLPGAPVELGFPVRYGADDEGAVIVPRDALVLGAVDTRVILVEDGAAKPVLVEVRATTATEALIVGPGLTAGSVLVTRGNERLRPGQAVRPLESGTAAGAEGEEAAT